MLRSLKQIGGHSRIDGIIPGIKGQRAFPNRAIENMDPFVMLDHIGPQQVGTDYFMDGRNSGHPHRGFETITFMFEGAMNHRDSLGNKARLDTGSVQRMNAGRGIQHGGDFFSDKNTGTFHEVQLWVNLPASHKMSQPDVFNVKANEIPVFKQGEAQVRVIAGEVMERRGPIKTVADIKVLHVINNTHQKISFQDFPAEYNVLVYALDGSFSVGETDLDEYHSAVFNNDGDSFDVTAKGEGQLLIIGGLPLKESVAMGGPFVMNTQEEIQQAYQDFRAGEFGEI